MTTIHHRSSVELRMNIALAEVLSASLHLNEMKEGQEQPLSNRAVKALELAKQHLLVFHEETARQNQMRMIQAATMVGGAALIPKALRSKLGIRPPGKKRK